MILNVERTGTTLVSATRAPPHVPGRSSPLMAAAWQSPPTRRKSRFCRYISYTTIASLSLGVELCESCYIHMCMLAGGATSWRELHNSTRGSDQVCAILTPTLSVADFRALRIVEAGEPILSAPQIKLCLPNVFIDRTPHNNHVVLRRCRPLAEPQASWSQ
eukprot:COSAG03_NODE_393_length_8278_cov_15.029343_3_plen_161_part_00